MFIDWLTLMLLNMTVAFVLYSLFMWRYIEKDPKKIIPGFLLTGAIALIAGFRMAFNWPLPGPFNIIYGELSVLFGGFLFMAGLAVAFGWDLLTIGIYALFGGAASVLLGIRILNLNLTPEPLPVAVGFIITGATAILTMPALALPKVKWLRLLVALGALVSALIWAFFTFTAYWSHMEAFGKWAPK
jgi:putative membrane protein